MGGNKKDIQVVLTFNGTKKLVAEVFAAALTEIMLPVCNIKKNGEAGINGLRQTPGCGIINIREDDDGEKDV